MLNVSHHYAQDISLHYSYIIQVSRQQDWAIGNDLQDNERGDLSQRQFELSLSTCAFSQLSSAWLTWHSSYLGEKVLPCSYMRMKYSGIKVRRLTFNKEPGTWPTAHPPQQLSNLGHWPPLPPCPGDWCHWSLAMFLSLLLFCCCFCGIKGICCWISWDTHEGWCVESRFILRTDMWGVKGDHVNIVVGWLVIWIGGHRESALSSFFRCY